MAAQGCSYEGIKNKPPANVRGFVFCVGAFFTMIKKVHILFAFILLGTSLFNLTVEAADIPKGLPREGDIISAFSVPVPNNQTFISYLMLKERGIFQPAEMDVKLLIIEVMNVY
ncbi:MAG: hypothetical protein C0403_16525 [Desulfobacterium sp.]|nr:hypothetical protein [Desulfobacterium sp.]